MSTGDVLGCDDNYIITLLLRPVAIGRYYTISAKTTKLQVHKIYVNSVIFAV